LNRRADWQLPEGVSRALWEYVQDAEVARHYDASLTDCSLFSLDLQFAERWLKPPGRLLDLGCGTGRLLVRMASLGHSVLGVDLSPEMLKAARAKAVDEGLRASFLQANIVELDCLADQAFDHAACLFSTLGMVEGSPARRRVVRNVFRLLKPGGVFVLHVHNWWFNWRDARGRRWLIADLLRRLRMHPAAGDRSMPGNLSNLTLHHFTRREISRLLRSEGFGIREMRPIGLGTDGKLSVPFLFPGLRAYGYLIAAQKSSGCTTESGKGAAQD